MAKILLWNVPAEYREALEKEARPFVSLETLEIDEVSGINQFDSKAKEATASGRPYTQIVAFLTEPSNVRGALDVLSERATEMQADVICHTALVPLPDFIAEFNRTFHPWKK